ncbi:hypothetical protein PLEOSDRAFT_172241, partial [Pleurotus ostreatus PC15]
MLASSLLRARPGIQEIDAKIESSNPEIGVIQAEIRCPKSTRTRTCSPYPKLLQTSYQSSSRRSHWMRICFRLLNHRKPTRTYSQPRRCVGFGARSRSIRHASGLHVCICTTSYRSDVFGPRRLCAFIP